MLTLLTIRVLFGLAVLTVFLTIAALATNSVAWVIGVRNLRQKRFALDPVADRVVVNSARRTSASASGTRDRAKPGVDGSDTAARRSSVDDGVLSVANDLEGNARDSAAYKPPQLPLELAVDDIIPLQGPVPQPRDDVLRIDRRTPPPQSSPAPVNPV